jgi:hypothetical protein
MPLGAEHDDAQEDGRHQLSAHICDDDDELAEVIGVGSDSRNNPARRELVVERQVVFGCLGKRLGSQPQHNIAHRPHHKRASRPVQAPGAGSNRQHHCPCQANGFQSWRQID